MIRLDLYLIGYRKYEFEEDKKVILENIFLRANKSIKIRENYFYLREDQRSKIEALTRGRVKLTASELLGFGGFLYRNRKRYGVICAMIISFIFLFLSSMLVYDVRIEGDGEFDRDKIIEELSESGLSVGSFWWKVDKSKIEVDMLSKSDDIAWININRRGSVAYVNVVTMYSPPPAEEETGYSNIVAKVDCVIEEINVERGIAVVKVGDTVKAGDLLVSGIISNENTTVFTHAKGEIVGRVSDKISVVIEDEKTLTKYEDPKLYSIKLNIFNFSINIFKSYRHFGEECDIIEDEVVYVSERGKRLPFSFTLTYKKSVYSEDIKLSDEQMVKEAAKESSKLLEERLKNATLLKIHTEGEFRDSSYYMNTYFLLSESVGVDLKFDFSGN